MLVLSSACYRQPEVVFPDITNNEPNSHNKFIGKWCTAKTLVVDKLTGDSIPRFEIEFFDDGRIHLQDNKFPHWHTYSAEYEYTQNYLIRNHPPTDQNRAFHYFFFNDDNKLYIYDFLANDFGLGFDNVTFTRVK